MLFQITIFDYIMHGWNNFVFYINAIIYTIAKWLPNNFGVLETSEWFLDKVCGLPDCKWLPILTQF